MDLLAHLMGGKGAEMIGALTGKGFSMEEAQGFLPDALENIVRSLQKSDVQGLMSTDSGSQITRLMGNIDIASLAARFGMDIGTASSGLQAVIPVVMGFLKDNPSLTSLLDLSGKGDSDGGLAGLARGLFS